MSDTTWVVFIDALSPRDLSRASFLDDTFDGEMEATVPRVTPSVTAQAYTGKGPEDTGMGRKHMFETADPSRPQAQTLMEELDARGHDVLNLYLPYTMPLDLTDGSASIGDDAGDTQIWPGEMSEQLVVPGPVGNLVDESNHQRSFDHFVDYITALFATARQLSEDYDVVFVGVREIDAYCHFQHETGPSGRNAPVGERYRDKLTEAIDIQLSQIDARGDDLFWWSDHGATERTETFYINKWLDEKGYADIEYDADFDARLYETGVKGPAHPADASIQNQETIGSAPVSFDEDESVAVCADAYDASITMLEDDPEAIRELVRDLRDEPVMRDVHRADAYYGRHGEFADQVPQVLPERGEGVFVSGNVHDDPIGMGYHRSGVHDKIGCYGSNVERGGRGRIDPFELYSRMRTHLNLD